jgi:hypothetical protein
LIQKQNLIEIFCSVHDESQFTVVYDSRNCSRAEYCEDTINEFWKRKSKKKYLSMLLKIVSKY